MLESDKETVLSATACVGGAGVYDLQYVRILVLGEHAGDNAAASHAPSLVVVEDSAV